MNTPEPKTGEYLVVIGARERAGRLEANARIMAFRDWYADLRRSYGGQQAEEAGK